MAGFDCSGFINEVRASVGLGPKADLTADGLFKHFAETKQVVTFDDPMKVNFHFHPGCLVWRGTDKLKTHVEMLINTWQTLGASGGGSATKTLEDAIKKNAYIKIRPIAGAGFGYMIDIFA